MSNDSPSSKRHRWSVPKRLRWVFILGVLVEITVLLYVGVSVLWLQIARPKLPKIYYTNDPFDTVRKGETYACGCRLPVAIQNVDNPSEKPNSGINRCYDKKELETVQILMFPNMTTGAILQPILNAFVPKEVYYNNMTDGYCLGQEAYDLSGRVVEDPLMDDLKSLFLSGKREEDKRPLISDIDKSFEFMSFPKSFLRLAFSYTCTNCTACPLEKINNISTVVSNDERWATCFHWDSWDRGVDRGDNCRTNNTYKAKCLLYPTTSLPPNFAISGFFKQLLSMPGIEERNIHSVTPGYTELEGYGSLQSSSLFLNASQIESREITMGFVEVARGSALRASVLNLFPTMDTSCSNISKVTVCNGTSVCNVFTNDKSTKNYELRCRDLRERDKCLNLMNGSTVDNSEHLWQGSTDINWDDINCGLADRPQLCYSITPNLVAWNITRRIASKMDALNEFLYDNILQEEWAQRTGVCTNTFENVFRYAQNGSASGNKLGEDNHTIYLESNCAPVRRGPGAGSGPPYCWLTGRYHNITDGPNQSGQIEWKELSSDPHFRDPQPSRRFVCYRVDQQKMSTWLIVSVGTVFGWIGTVHMIFRGFWWVLKKWTTPVDEHTCGCLKCEASCQTKSLKRVPTKLSGS